MQSDDVGNKQASLNCGPHNSRLCVVNYAAESDTIAVYQIHTNCIQYVLE